METQAISAWEIKSFDTRRRALIIIHSPALITRTD